MHAEMAKRARLTTEQVLEGWENFEEEVEDWGEHDTIREPIMPGSDDEFSDIEEMLAEEEEDNHERVETEIVQEVQRRMERRARACAWREITWEHWQKNRERMMTQMVWIHRHCRLLFLETEPHGLLQEPFPLSIHSRRLLGQPPPSLTVL